MKVLLTDTSGKVFIKMTVLPIFILLVSMLLFKLTHSHFWTQVMPLFAGLIFVVMYYGWLWSTGIAVIRVNGSPGVSSFKTAFLAGIILFLS